MYDPTDTGATPSYDVFTDPIVETSLATSTCTTMRYDEIADDTADQTTSANEDYADTVAVETTKYMEVMEGWFLAPATGNFRFYMSCDDNCRLDFDTTNYFFSGGTVSYTTLIDVTSYMTFR